MLFTNTPDDNEVKAGECGAIDAIISAMKVHINDSGVCEQGCGALYAIGNNGKHQHHRDKTIRVEWFHKLFR